jgi:chemotaxis family two-component system sensor kinase Cph1
MDGMAGMGGRQGAPPAAGASLWHDFWSTDFMPHGCCYIWQPLMLWPHVISDALICVAYYSIPVILFAFARQRRDIPFSSIFVIFGVFIMACGTTHLLEVISVWYPVYRLSAVVKIITAIVSVMAVYMLIPILPKALALPSLQAANEQLQKTSGELRRSNAELEQFAYVASHDLQEPLRMVSMHVELLKRRHGSQLDETGKSYLAQAAAGTERMRQLMASLLTFARIDQVPLPSGLTDANLALADALSNLSVMIATQQAVLTQGTLPSVRMERTQLVQVLQNLVANAIKFRRADVARPTVHVTAVRSGREVVFSVQDNGIGIEAAHFERIFIVFQRIHDRESYDGSGIGLASVKKIVERHGGRVWLESQPGIGSIFHFSVLADEHPPGAPSAP